MLEETDSLANFRLLSITRLLLQLYIYKENMWDFP